MSSDVITQAEFEKSLAVSLAQYERYRRILYATDKCEIRMADYGWRPMDQPSAQGPLMSFDIAVMAFNEMSREFAGEVANYINKLVTAKNRIQAWADLLKGIEDDGEKWNVLHEFVNPLLYLGLGLPYSIKQKFIFSFSHLSHQLRLLQTPGHLDDLAGDGKINDKTAKRFLGDCRSGDQLLDSIDKVASENFSYATNDFRNGFNHRITPGVEAGIKRIVTRGVAIGGTGDPIESMIKDAELEPLKSGEKRVVYGIGGVRPIPLCEVVRALREEIETIHECFDRYKGFVIDREAWVIQKFGSVVKSP